MVSVAWLLLSAIIDKREVPSIMTTLTLTLALTPHPEPLTLTHTLTLTRWAWRSLPSWRPR